MRSVQVFAAGVVVGILLIIGSVQLARSTARSVVTVKSLQMLARLGSVPTSDGLKMVALPG